jgi:predicted DNA-binding protein
LQRYNFRVTAPLKEAEYKQLLAIAKKEKRPLAEVLREIIEAALREAG